MANHAQVHGTQLYISQVKLRYALAQGVQIKTKSVFRFVPRLMSKATVQARELCLLILFLQQRAELINSAHHATFLVVHRLYEGIAHVRHQKAEAEERIRLSFASFFFLARAFKSARPSKRKNVFVYKLHKIYDHISKDPLHAIHSVDPVQTNSTRVPKAHSCPAHSGHHD